MKILGFNDADILPNLSENLAGSEGLSAIAKTMLICGTISIFLQLVLSSTIMAGTENGEFCPTCPDWTDLEGWQSKKDAYEQSQPQTVPLQKQLTVQKTQDQEPTAQAVNDSASANSSQMRTGRFAEALVSP